MISQSTIDQVIRTVCQRIPSTTLLIILRDLRKIDGGQSFNDSIAGLVKTLEGRRGT